MSETNNSGQELNIELSKEVAKGNYSNLAIITHSHSEFIIDNVAILPGVPKAEVVSRIIMTPENAKRLLAALRDNLVKYESQFGEIKIVNEATNTIPLPFGPNTGKA